MTEQIDLLANFIMAEVEGEPSQSEGACECAIRIIKQLKADKEILKCKLIEAEHSLQHALSAINDALKEE